MKQIIILFSTLFILNSCTKKLHLVSGELVHKEYLDTIKYKDKYGLISVETKINGNKKTLIFDTGADMLVLNKDTSISKSNITAKIKDSNGNVTNSGFDKINELQISGLKYTDLYATRMNFPILFNCIADGIIGNNIISHSNWKITNDCLIASSKPFQTQEKSKSINYFFYSSYRFFSNFSVNGYSFDTCLIDYGGRFEIELPMKHYDEFNRNLKIRNKITKVISSAWGVNGKSKPDTSIIVNCDIDLSGISIDNVNVTFSKKNKERRIGALLLRRFNAIYIDTKQRKIFFELPVSINKDKVATYFSVDLGKDYFIVDGKSIEVNDKLVINIGDELKSVNGKKPNEFASYCEFLEWLQDLRKTKSIIALTKENKEIKIDSQN